MEYNKIKTIFNPYDYLPTYGENKLDLFFKNGKLRIDVYFDSSNGNENKFSISFNKTVYHLYQDFPGIVMSKINHPHYLDFDNLVEFEVSNVKTAWEKHFNGKFKLRHFKIFFTSQNKLLEVISEDFNIETQNIKIL